jgi:hypothetical protein
VFVLDRREDFPRIVMGICAYGAIIDHARERSEYNLVDVPRPYRSIIRGKYSLESTRRFRLCTRPWSMLFVCIYDSRKSFPTRLTECDDDATATISRRKLLRHIRHLFGL